MQPDHKSWYSLNTLINRYFESSCYGNWICERHVCHLPTGYFAWMEIETLSSYVLSCIRKQYNFSTVLSVNA